MRTVAATAVLASLVAFGAGGTVCAPTAFVAARADVASALSLPIERSRLDNGLEVLLLEDHRTPIASVNIWYHVGSKDEPQGRTASPTCSST